MTALRVISALSVAFLLTIARGAAADDENAEAAAGLETTVLLQNEVSDSNGNPKAITKALVLLSANINGSNRTSRSLKENGADVSVSNPLASMSQADDLTVSSGSGFKWVQLVYRVAGSSTDVYTGACIVNRGTGGGRDHYLQQVIIRPRSTDGRQTQFQAEDLRKPQTFAATGDEPTSGLFAGSSETGDLSAAILSAANAALEAHPTFVRWELQSVSGERGGIAGAKKVTAVIRVATADAPQAASNGDDAEYAESGADRSAGYISLRNETDDLQEVVIAVSNWRHAQNWTVQNGRPRQLSNLPAVGYGVSAFNPNHPRRPPITADTYPAFTLRVPFEVTVTGSAGHYKLEISPLE
jgi:hypothetical protein